MKELTLKQKIAKLDKIINRLIIATQENFTEYICFAYIDRCDSKKAYNTIKVEFPELFKSLINNTLRGNVWESFHHSPCWDAVDSIEEHNQVRIDFLKQLNEELLCQS